MADLSWNANRTAETDKFLEDAGLAINFLGNGNFAQAQVYVLKAINDRLLIKGLTERRESDRYLFGVIKPMLSNYGFTLEENSLTGNVSLMQIKAKDSGSILPLLGILLILGGVSYFTIQQLRTA